MKNIHRIAFAAVAFGVVAVAPSATAGEPVLPLKQYVSYARLINSADPAENTNVIASAVSEVVKAAGDSTQQAAGEVASAVAAVSTFRSESDGELAAAVFSCVVAAVSEAGADPAESLGLAKIAAAAGALVSGNADFMSGATAGLAAAVAAEVKAALENVDETLADLDPYALKDVYEKSLAALRGSNYKMKEDEAEATLLTGGARFPGGAAGVEAAAAAIGVGAGVGLSGGGTVSSFEESIGAIEGLDRPTPTTLPGSGIFVGEIKPPVEPVKKPKPKKTHPSPTPAAAGL